MKNAYGFADEALATACGSPPGGLHGIPERLIDGIEKAGTKVLTVAS
ncbi:hypothetical protein [Nioella sp. MMSF_3534]|nr:hypothetical protein [Nioella sp. MMSF_3534]